ncbi:type II toxin-antitoxin system PemK/MazF family toxin [Paenibacillus hexagrammi]|uniref:Type II toxin-antitoxin system PemK/MazF family toxin n=1 Tax=Paenibacillus hexagrammi TaxID=2908839 RepID=A0ABY3SQN9_9BACL|nr:type II toxin-antitoxin system PemK/MazF family toxin [Paenibacillus sp. YPD9-1]UJF35715.1 type II toxin-antitoxin system PemK/MazF family toxin [Paenibacillus sp. YPD9-1]
MSADRGDLVWINFNPQAGHEQSGRRSAIVLSPKAFNETTGFVSVCPITHTVRGWGYEVLLPNGLVFNGVILTDQIKNLDWRARRVDIVGQAPDEVVNECLDKIHTFL